jgi:hypothetical protein
MKKSLYFFLALTFLDIHHTKANTDHNVGVFYQPSWNLSLDESQWIDSMWACLQSDYKNCSIVQPGSAA